METLAGACAHPKQEAHLHTCTHTHARAHTHIEGKNRQIGEIWGGLEVNCIIKRKNEGEEEGKRDTQTWNTWRETKKWKI